MKIVNAQGKLMYFDDNGKEIHEGDEVIINGKNRVVYLTQDGFLGIDATNPSWISKGWASPCEYGIYPFEETDSVIVK